MKSTPEQEKICKQFLLSKMGQEYLDNMKIISPTKSMSGLVIDLFEGYSEEKTSAYAAEDFRDLKKVFPELASFIGSKISSTTALSKEMALKQLEL